MQHGALYGVYNSNRVHDSNQLYIIVLLLMNGLSMRQRDLKDSLEGDSLEAISR